MEDDLEGFGVCCEHDEVSKTPVECLRGFVGAFLQLYHLTIRIKQEVRDIVINSIIRNLLVRILRLKKKVILVWREQTGSGARRFPCSACCRPWARRGISLLSRPFVFWDC